jgi:hypothetical protein
MLTHDSSFRGEQERDGPIVALGVRYGDCGSESPKELRCVLLRRTFVV